MDEPDNLRLNPQPSSSFAAYTTGRRVWKISMDSREKLLKYPYADTEMSGLSGPDERSCTLDGIPERQHGRLR